MEQNLVFSQNQINNNLISLVKPTLMLKLVNIIGLNYQQVRNKIGKKSNK